MIEVLHVYRDALFNEYGDEDVLPEGFTANAVYPILESSVECSDENSSSPPPEDTITLTADNDNSSPLHEEMDQSKGQEEEEEEEENPTVALPPPISEKQMDDEFLHLSIRVSELIIPSIILYITAMIILCSQSFQIDDWIISID